MRKVIKGCFQIETNGMNAEAFINAHFADMRSIVDWGDENGVMIRIGTSNNNECLCDYKVVCITYSECRELANALKKEIRAHFKKIERIWEIKGEMLY